MPAHSRAHSEAFVIHLADGRWVVDFRYPKPGTRVAEDGSELEIGPGVFVVLKQRTREDSYEGCFFWTLESSARAVSDRIPGSTVLEIVR